MEQIRLDLIPGKSAPVCHASQYDVGRTIRLNLVEGGSEYSIPSGTTAEIHIRKPDNNIISAAVTATQGNKYIDIVTAEQWTACAGTNLCEIVLTNGGNVIGTINFILEVEMDPIDGGSASESVIYNIQALVDTAVALHTFLIHITETTMTETAADILDAINSNKILQVIYKPDANSLTTHILPLTLDSGARPDGIRALAFASFWDSKLYAADIVLDSVHSTVSSVSTINGKDLDETGDFPIHINNSTITETAGEVIDAMADGLRPYVIWTNNSQSNYTFTYGLAAVWNPDANTETLIFGCPITGAVRTIHVFIDPTARTYRSSIQIVDYSIPQIVDNSTSSSSVWSSQKTAGELAGKAEIDDDAVSSSTAWSSEQIVSLLPTESASGAVANFETPLTLPLVSHIVTIEPVQSGTGDPSPSNVRPISGWSAVNVTRTGANIWDEQWELGLINTNNGTNGDDTTRIRSKNYIPIKADATYYIGSDGGATYLFFYDKDKNYLGYHGTNKNNSSFTPELLTNTKDPQISFENAYFVRFRHDVTTNNNVFINYPAMDTTYHAYTGQTYTRTFLDSNDDPVTVYGGSNELVSGEGDTTWKGVKLSVLDFSTLSSPTNHIFRSTYTDLLSDVLGVEHNYDLWSGFTEKFTNKSYQNISTSDDGYFAISMPSTNRIVFIDQACSTVEQFVNAHGNDLLVYPLATPQTFHCDPLILETLKGVNNIWADTGDTAVEFKQDIQTYIDSRLSSGTRSLSLAKAPVETKEETKQEEKEGDESLTR